MRILLATALITVSSWAQAASIPMYDLPLKNGAPGAVYKMSDYPNAVFVFESYRLGCGYCNSNAVNVDRLADEYRPNPRVQVLDLGLDTTDDMFAQWIQRHKPNHPVVQDVGFKIFKAFRTQNAIPQVFIANCHGELVGSALGEWNHSLETQIRGYIDQALETTCTETSGK